MNNYLFESFVSFVSFVSFQSFESFELFVSFKSFESFESCASFKSFESFESFVSFKSFVWMRFNMYSFNYLCEKDFNILSNLMNLFLGGFNAAYLLFFNWTMYALFVLSFFASYIFFVVFIKYCQLNIRVICFKFSRCYVNEIVFIFIWF